MGTDDGRVPTDFEDYTNRTVFRPGINIFPRQPPGFARSISIAFINNLGEQFKNLVEVIKGAGYDSLFNTTGDIEGEAPEILEFVISKNLVRPFYFVNTKIDTDNRAKTEQNITDRSVLDSHQI